MTLASVATQTHTRMRKRDCMLLQKDDAGPFYYGISRVRYDDGSVDGFVKEMKIQTAHCTLHFHSRNITSDFALSFRRSWEEAAAKDLATVFVFITHLLSLVVLLWTMVALCG